jgi:hypothetical protein
MGHFWIIYTNIEIGMGHYIINSNFLPNTNWQLKKTWAYGPWPLPFLIPEMTINFVAIIISIFVCKCANLVAVNFMSLFIQLTLYRNSNCQVLTFPGSSLDLGTLRKHLFRDKLCLIEF